MTKGDLEKIKEVRNKLTDDYMLRCSFYSDSIESMLDAPQTTVLVVESTAIWRKTWILEVLDRLISKYDKSDTIHVEQVE